MSRRLILYITFFIYLCLPANAQENSTFLKHLSLSAGVSTMGAGFQLATPLGSHWGVRAGFSALPLNFSYNYYEGDFEITTDAKARLYNGNMLADWYPKENGLFHVTSGLYFGESGGTGIARSADSYTLRGKEFTADYFGTADIKVKTAFLKPYLGVGLGRLFTNSRFGFKCELGAMYHGTPDVQVVNNTVFSLSVGDLPEFRKEVVKYKFYPMLSLQLVYKLY